MPWALALGLGAGGCALPIEPAESGITTPIPFVGAPATPAPAAAPDPDWWQAFGAR